MLNKTEILAPAGNTEAVRAGINAYADAVYLGAQYVRVPGHLPVILMKKNCLIP